MNPPSVSSQTNTDQAIVRIPLWVSLVVIIGALLSLLGAVISKINPGMLANGGVVTEMARVYADYMFARSLALAILLLFLLAIRARRMLTGLMVLIALIQIIDVGDDLVRGAWLLVPGLLVFALIFLVGAWKLFGRAIWQIDAWRDA